MILSSQSSVKINSSNLFLISPSIRQFFCEFTRIPVLSHLPYYQSENLSKNGLKRARNRCIQPTNQHTHCSIPKQNLSQANCSNGRYGRRFWAKMLQYSTPVSPTTKYILQLFFLQFKYFRIRQLENLRAKRRTPFARNFSHFKTGKKVKLNRDLANPQFFQYLCTNTISNPVSKSVFCSCQKKAAGIKQILKVKNRFSNFGNDFKLSTCSHY